jgi:hypothetical protein
LSVRIRELAAAKPKRLRFGEAWSGDPEFKRLDSRLRGNERTFGQTR